MRRAVLARSVWVFTFMPGVGVRRQLAASTRSPSISTMQTRQLPSGAVAGLGRVAQMRQLDVEAARGAEDRLALADVDLLVVDEEGVGLLPSSRSSRSLSLTNVPAAWSVRRGRYFSTHNSGFGAAWPRPQIEASRIRSDSSVSSAASHGPCSISLAAFSLPTRQGVHWPQLSSSKNFIRLSATAFMSSFSDRITTACDPTKQPYFSSVPKSSGSSAIDAGRMPPDAPPGR